MKKLLAIMLSLAMVVSLAACSNGDGDDTNSGDGDGSSTTTTTTPAAGNDGNDSSDDGESSDTTPKEETPPAEAEEISYTPVVSYSFEDATGLSAVFQSVATDDPTLTGATYALMPSVHDIMIAEGKGVNGSNALYLDGKYGVKLDNMAGTSDNTYTISFWYAASRYSQFGAIVQMGRNIGMADDLEDNDKAVTWINFTKADAWSVEAGDAAPVAWNKNSYYDPTNAYWPWIGNNSVDIRGKKEWCHVTLVVTGEEVSYSDVNGEAWPTRIGAKFYVDGELMMEFNSDIVGDDNTWMGVAPDILTGGGVYGVEGLIGINYWDAVYKGYIDELVIYDEALTPGQVMTLYQQGAPTGDYEDLEYDGPVDGE